MNQSPCKVIFVPSMLQYSLRILSTTTTASQTDALATKDGHWLPPPSTETNQSIDFDPGPTRWVKNFRFVHRATSPAAGWPPDSIVSSIYTILCLWHLGPPTTLSHALCFLSSYQLAFAAISWMLIAKGHILSYLLQAPITSLLSISFEASTTRFLVPLDTGDLQSSAQ